MEENVQWEIKNNWGDLENFLSLATNYQKLNKISVIILFEKLKNQLEQVPTQEQFLESVNISTDWVEKELKSWENFLDLQGYDPWYRDNNQKYSIKSKNYNEILKAKFYDVLNAKPKTETDLSPKPSNQLNFPQIRKKLFMMLEKDSKNLELFENIEKHLSAVDQNILREIIDELKNQLLDISK